MMIRIVIWLSFLSCLFGKEPDFELLSAKKCQWHQGRPEMGKAFEYEFQLVNKQKIKKVQFQYLLLDGIFIPLSSASEYDKINKYDTITLHALQFKNRKYDADSLYIHHLDKNTEGLLFLYKNEPHVLELNKIKYKDCPEKRKRM